MDVLTHKFIYMLQPLDHIHQNWLVVVKINSRNFYDIPSEDDDEEAKTNVDGGEAVREAYVPLASDGTTSLDRVDVSPDMVDAAIVRHELQHHKKKGKMQALDDTSESESSDEEDQLLFTDETENEPL